MKTCWHNISSLTLSWVEDEWIANQKKMHNRNCLNPFGAKNENINIFYQRWDRKTKFNLIKGWKIIAKDMMSKTIEAKKKEHQSIDNDDCICISAYTGTNQYSASAKPEKKYTPMEKASRNWNVTHSTGISNLYLKKSFRCEGAFITEWLCSDPVQISALLTDLIKPFG